MKTKIQIRALALAASIAMAAPTAVLALSMSLPSLAFPNAKTGWGCQLISTCPKSSETKRE